MPSEGSKALTIRIPDEQAAELEAVARVQGVPVVEEIRAAIADRIQSLRRDTEFRKRLRESIERDRELLERLAKT